MSRRIAYPFLTLSDASVVSTPWEISLNGSEWFEVPEYLPDWDYQSTIRVRRSVRVDPDIGSKDLQLPDQDLKLGIVVRAGTGQGRMPRSIIDWHREEGYSLNCEFEIPGRVLSVLLDLRTEVTLNDVPVSPGPLSPNAVGYRLWTESICMRLEGEEPRFPIEVANFGSMLGQSIASSAPWYLYWSPADWERDFHGAIRLYVNQDSHAVIERIEAQDGLLFQAILGDVLCQVCAKFIFEPDAVQMMLNPEPGSLAAQAATWLAKAWPGRDIKFLRAVYDSRPGEFRSALLALAQPEGK